MQRSKVSRNDNDEGNGRGGGLLLTEVAEEFVSRNDIKFHATMTTRATGATKKTNAKKKFLTEGAEEFVSRNEAKFHATITTRATGATKKTNAKKKFLTEGAENGDKSGQRKQQ